MDTENNYSMESGGMNRSVDDETKREGINTQEAKLSYQQQTVLKSLQLWNNSRDNCTTIRHNQRRSNKYHKKGT